MPRHVLTPLDDAQRALVERHVPLALRWAKYYINRWPKRYRHDLVSAAMWGLCLAARSFRPGEGAFGIYASSGIEMTLRDTLRTISVPLGYRRDVANAPQVDLVDELPEPSRPGVLPREPAGGRPQATYL